MKKIFTIMILTMLFFMGCGKDKNKNISQETIKYVDVEPVAMRDISDVFKAVVTLEPEKKVDYILERGGTVKAIYKKNGDFVKKGESIVSFTNENLEADYLRAKSNYETSKFQYNLAKEKFEKFKVLYDKQLISYLEFSNYKSAYISSKELLDSSQAMFLSIKKDYDDLTEKAKFDGIIGDLFLKVGNKVKAGEKIFTLLNNGEMQGYIYVSPEAITKVKVGDKLVVKVDALSRNFTGNVVEINPIADKVSKNFKVKLSLDNSNKLINDGMYGEVEILLNARRALTINADAIVVKDLIPYVFKYENGKVVEIQVQKGATKLPYVEISSPNIKLGDLIVTKGILGLQSNDKVKIKNEVTK